MPPLEVFAAAVFEGIIAKQVPAMLLMCMDYVSMAKGVAIGLIARCGGGQGLYDTEREKCSINPRTDRLVTETSDLVMLHPTSVRATEYRPSLFPADAEIGERPCFSMHPLCSCSRARGCSPLLRLALGVAPPLVLVVPVRRQGETCEVEVAAFWLARDAVICADSDGGAIGFT